MPHTKATLPVVSMHMLAIVIEHGEISQATLATRMGLYEEINTGSALRALQRRGCVHSRKEGRLMLWSATEAGQRMHREHHRHHGERAAPRHTHHDGPPWAPPPWRPEVARPGCMDHVRLPSLMGGVRVYRRDAGQA